MADGILGAMKYRDYYKEKLEQGLIFQDYVGELLYSLGIPIICYGSKKYQIERGENKLGIEIKFDDKYEETGNLYIEIAEKSHPSIREYFPSGIYRDDNTWLYAIGNYTEVFLFSKTMLKLIENRYRHLENNTKTSKGFLIPSEDAHKFAIRVLDTGKINGAT